MWTTIWRPWSFSLSGGVLLSAALVLNTTTTLFHQADPIHALTGLLLGFFLTHAKRHETMKGCLVDPFLCLYMPLHSLLYNIHPRCKIKLPVTKHAIHCNQMSSFSHRVVWGGVSWGESRHQLVGKRYNSITLQNRQGWFCSLMGCCMEFKVAHTFVNKWHNAEGVIGHYCCLLVS